MDSAFEAIFAHARVLGTETVPVDTALLGRVLAEDVRSPHDIPRRPTTNVDGYAVKGGATSFSEGHSVDPPCTQLPSKKGPTRSSRHAVTQCIMTLHKTSFTVSTLAHHYRQVRTR